MPVRLAGVSFVHMATITPPPIRYVEDDGTEVVATALGPYYDGDRASSQDPARGGLDVRAQLGDRGGADRVVVERRLEEDLGAALRLLVRGWDESWRDAAERAVAKRRGQVTFTIRF